MSAPVWKFWRPNWPERLGISSRQLFSMLVLLAALLSGLWLSHLPNRSSSKIVYEDEKVEYQKFQAKVSEIERRHGMSSRVLPRGGKKLSAIKVDLNLAGEKELRSLPGIGSVLAKRILDFRRKNGKFKRVDELKQVKGIGENKFRKLLPYIEVK